MRYFDLKEVSEFITYVVKNTFAKTKMRLDRYFENLDDINMKNIKIYYIQLLQNILGGTWGEIYTYFKHSRKPRISNNDTIDPKGNKITKSRSLGPGVTTSNSKLAGAPLSRLASEQLINKESFNDTKTSGSAGVYVTTKDADWSSWTSWTDESTF